MAKKTKTTAPAVTKQKMDAMESVFENEVKLASKEKQDPKAKWEIKDRD